MTTVSPRHAAPVSGPDEDSPVPDGLPNAGLYRESVVQAYRQAPQSGSPNRGGDPSTMRPRWWSAIVAGAVVVAMVVAGLLVQVPVRSSGVVVSTDGNSVFIAVPGSQLPAVGDRVTIGEGSLERPGVVTKVEPPAEASMGASLLVIQTPGSRPVSDFQVGKSATYSMGERAILWDLIQR